MAIIIEISDRQYDYTDEQKASEAISEFQVEKGIDDFDLIEHWKNEESPIRKKLEQIIFSAVDQNGTLKRAMNSIPSGINLFIQPE